MGLTGRYNFKGIQRAVGVAIDALFAGTSWGAWILASPFKPVIDAIKNQIVNYLANQGLILLNLGAIVIDGKVDQQRLDAALDDAFNKMKVGRDKITPEEGKAIDDEVRTAFDQDADINATNSDDDFHNVVPDVSTSPVRSGDNTPV